MHNCPECGNKDLRLNDSSKELVCFSCGLVLEDQPLTNPFLTFSEQNRASHPYLSEAGGKLVQGKIYKNHWGLSTRAKNIRDGMNKIQFISSSMNLPTFVITEIKTLFKECVNAGLTVGRGTQEVIYACSYLACLIHNLPKTSLEFVRLDDVNKKTLLRTVKKIRSGLNISTGVLNPVDIIPRFANNLGVKPTTTTFACTLAMDIKENGFLLGKKPETIAASAIYLAGVLENEDITQRNVSNQTGVLEVTIRKRSNEIKERFLL